MYIYYLEVLEVCRALKRKEEDEERMRLGAQRTGCRRARPLRFQKSRCSRRLHFDHHSSLQVATQHWIPWATRAASNLATRLACLAVRPDGTWDRVFISTLGSLQLPLKAAEMPS